MVVQKDPQGRFELSRFCGDLVDRDAVQVERSRVRNGLDFGHPRCDGSGSLGVDNDNVVVVGSFGDVQIVDGWCPGKSTGDIGAGKVEQTGWSVKPHVFACFEFGDLCARVRGVVELTSETEHVVGLASGSGEELVSERGERDGDADVGE